MIFEDFGEIVEPALTSVVYKDIQDVKGEKYIKFNDNNMEFNDKFNLYIVTLLSNPHFSPEVHART